MMKNKTDITFNADNVEIITVKEGEESNYYSWRKRRCLRGEGRVTIAHLLSKMISKWKRYQDTVVLSRRSLWLGYNVELTKEEIKDLESNGKFVILPDKVMITPHVIIQMTSGDSVTVYCDTLDQAKGLRDNISLHINAKRLDMNSEFSAHIRKITFD